MNTLKGWITTTVLMATLMVSTTFANGGIIIVGRNRSAPAPCTETKKGDDKNAIGIIITGVGIIITGLTGIIITGGAEQPPVDCGIIIVG